MENQRGLDGGDSHESSLSTTKATDSAETNLELSRQFYNQTLYKTVERLIKTCGKNIYQDLCFLLRQMTLSRVAYQKSVERDILRDCGVNIKLEIELDPYESLDLFIARPRSYSYNPNHFGFITSGWEFKYGTSIKQELAKLEQANQRLFFYQAKKIFDYIEAAFGKDLELHKSIMNPEVILESLTLTNEVSIESSGDESKKSLDSEIKRFSNKQFYVDRFTKLLNDLASKLDPEEREQLDELFMLLTRIEEFNVEQAFAMIASSVDKGIKEKFGVELEAKLDVKYKYSDQNLIKDTGVNSIRCSRSSIATEFVIIERNKD